MKRPIYAEMNRKQCTQIKKRTTDEDRTWQTSTFLTNNIKKPGSNEKRILMLLKASKKGLYVKVLFINNFIYSSRMYNWKLRKEIFNDLSSSK